MAYQYKREPLSIEESDQLMTAAQSVQERLCVWGLLETGLRVSELADLKRDQLQWQQRAIRVKGKGGPFGKRSKLRVVPISKLLMPILQHHFALHERFPYGRRTIQKVVKRVANRAQITRPVSPHVLRHTFAIRWLHNNGTTRSLQAILGHDHLTTTEIYLNLSPEDVLAEFHAKW